jgi:hypothetical protein
LILLLLAPACERRRAHVDECAAILDRLVTLTLEERGFRDPALAARTGDALHHDLLPELERCHERPWDAAHYACVQQAKSVDELRARCLRR